MPVSFFVVTPEVTAYFARFHTDFNVARMTALEQLPGNLYQVEVRAFDGGADGPVWACKSRSPLLRGKNRFSGFTASCLPSLQDLLRFFREDDLRCTFAFYGPMTPDTFDALTNAGLWSGGGGTVPVATVTAANPAGETDIAAVPLGVVICETAPDEKDLCLDAFRQAFGARTEAQADYLAFQWAEDTLWDARRYIAFADGVPAAMASFLVRDGIGFCGTAGTVPRFAGAVCTRLCSPGVSRTRPVWGAIWFWAAARCFPLRIATSSGRACASSRSAWAGRTARPLCSRPPSRSPLVKRYNGNRTLRSHRASIHFRGANLFCGRELLDCREPAKPRCLMR